MTNIKIRTLWLLPMLALGGVACGAEAPIDSSGDFAPQSEQGATPGNLSVELGGWAEGTGSLEYRLINTGGKALRFLPWDTAILGVAGNLFDVRHGDVRVPYVGPSVVFAPPREENFAELQPGESLSTTIQLAELYDMAQPGVYSVSARPRMLTPFPGSRVAQRAQLAVESSAITISVDADHVHRPIEVAVPSAPSEVEKALQPACVDRCIQGCSGGGDPQRTIQCLEECPGNCNPRATCDEAEDISLNAANAEAGRLLPTAISSIDPPAATGLRQVYLDYFGVRTDARMAEVNRVLGGARVDITDFRQLCFNVGDVPTGSGSFGCDGPGVRGIIPILAETNGSALGLRVAYCPAFFANPFTGVARSLRERATTVVHEASHHFGIEDIRDLTDGLVNSAAAARSLAAIDAQAAISSAVNYSSYVTDPRFP